MGFKKGDTVKVLTTSIMHSQYKGKTGEVVEVYSDNGTYSVKLEWPAPEGSMFESMGVLGSFFESELELVDEKQEALIELAETLDKARLQANAIDVYTIQSQTGLYGDITRALTDTLEVIFDGQVDDENLFANLAYNSILDGNTVREAIAQVVKK